MKKIKRIPLRKSFDDFRDEDSYLVLCGSGVDEYFDIEGNDSIVLVLSSYEVENSYEVCYRWPYLRVTLSNGEDETMGVYIVLADVINEFGGSCYLSIEI